MTRFTIVTALMLSLFFSVGAQALRTPPPYVVSIPPTSLVFSYYDYMIGGYNATPVQVVPDAQGGGLLMLFHTKRTATGQRKVDLARIDSDGSFDEGMLVSGDLNYAGYPSLDIDEQSGLAFMAWHEQLSGDQDYSVVGRFGIYLNGSLILGNPQTIFNYALQGFESIWPVVQFGPSPNAGMRRIYVLGKGQMTTFYGAETYTIAYADFNPQNITDNSVLTWNYTSVQETYDWAMNQTVYRRPFITMVVGNNGSVYLCGYHIARVDDSSIPVDEPNLDVFIWENYGTVPWRRVSAHAEELPSCPPPMITGPVYTNVRDCGHINAVLDAEGNIHFPELCVYHNEYEGELYFYPTTYSLKQIEFNTTTETFRLDDLFPQGATPHAAPAYTPWDINEDCLVDTLDNQGYAVYPWYWPFPYYDSEPTTEFNYNLQLMTEPNAQGWMACVWQNTHRTWMDPVYQYMPEIYISISPDHGWTWLEPIVLNSVETPALADNMPMWVYPANQIIIMNHADTTATGRLYLMFYDDEQYGAQALVPTSGLGGTVKYMALDIMLPFTPNTDPVLPVSDLALQQNYPNPFTTQTTIKYSLATEADVSLSVYNVKGQLVRSFQQKKAKAGEHILTWDGRDTGGDQVSSGLYICMLGSKGKTMTRKMIVLR